VDGYTHEDKVEEDLLRDQKLKAFGYHVLRIQDEEIFGDLENVNREIEYTIEQIEMKIKLA
jgi:very-short-patch-repair endonuclease